MVDFEREFVVNFQCKYMTNTIAILIPTYRRHQKLAALAANIHANTVTAHTIYFIVEHDDHATRDTVREINETWIPNIGGDWINGINTGYRHTDEPFILCAADDLDFGLGWDTELLKVMDDPTVGVSGPIDSWPISQTGFHTSHPFIRRAYIEQYSGVEDEKNVVLSTAYHHYMADIELEQVAIKRGTWRACPTSIVEHVHWVNEQAEHDETYKGSEARKDDDTETYQRRRGSFEQYVLEELYNGRIIKATRLSSSEE